MPGKNSEPRTKKHSSTYDFWSSSQSQNLLFQCWFEQSFQFAWLLESNGRILAVNQKVLDLTGLQPEAIISQDFWKFSWESSDEATLKTALTSVTPNTPQRCQLKTLDQDGQAVILDLVIQSLTIPNQPQPILLVEAWDVTSYQQQVGQLDQQLQSTISRLTAEMSKHHQIESALRQVKDQFRYLTEAIPQQIWIARLNGQVEYVNRQMLTYFNCSAQQILKDDWKQWIHPQDLLEYQKIWKLAVHKGETLEVEVRLRQGHSRAYRWFLIRAVPVLDDIGRISKWFGTNTDIHEHKQVENQLRDSEFKLRTIVENSEDAITLKDLEGRYLFINSAGANFLNLTVAEILGKQDIELFTPETGAAIWQADQGVMNSGISQTYEEVGISNGLKRTYLSTKTPYLSPQGELLGIIGICRDITERKQSEEFLRQQLAAVEAASDGIAILDHESQYIYLNRAHLTLFGYEQPEELIGKTWKELYEDEEIKRIEQEIFPIILRDGKWRGEATAKRRDGTTFDEEVSLSWIEGVGLICVCQDISDRKRAEADLQIRDRAIAASQNGIVIADARLPDIPLIYANPAFEQITGYKVSEVLGKNCRFLQGLDSQQAELDILRTALREGCDCTVILRNYRQDGSLFWNEFSISPIYDHQGTLTHYIGIQTDITERKQAEEDLRLSQERLQYLLTSSPGVIYTCKAEGDYGATFMSHNVKTLFGYESWEFTQDSSFWASRLHPEDAPRILSNLERLFEQGYHSHEYRFLHRDGTYRWVYDQIKLLRDVTGKPLEIIGYWTDISDRKQAEEQLQHAKDQLQAVLDATPGLVSWIDSNLHYLGVNQQLAHVFNRLPEDFIGKEVGFEQSSSSFTNFINQFFASSLEQTSQEIDAIVDGETHSYLIVAQKYNRGQAAVSVGVDITERKQTLEELRTATSRLTALIENLQVGVLVKDELGRVVLTNQTFCNFFEIPVPPAALIGADFSDFAQKFKNLIAEPEHFIQRHHDILRSSQIVANEELQFANGQTLERDYVPIAVNESDAGHLWMYRDVTERKQVEAKIQASLQEKETLLKEIHHRVKNNLQIISSLLRLQSRQLLTPRNQDLTLVDTSCKNSEVSCNTLNLVRDLFQESQNRVQTMALVHEQLYRSDNLAEINFQNYLQTLVNNLFRSYDAFQRGITFEVNVERVSLSIDTAIPCGLMINELVSNSLKYAFPNRRGGEIRIDLQPLDKKQLLLQVRDNGIGLPETIDFQKLSSLGLQLVNRLAHQLNGEIRVERSLGTTFKITLKKN